MVGSYKLYNSVNEISEPVHCVVTSPPYFRLRKYGDSDKELGTEKDPELYCKNLVEVFNSIPLHPKGSVWVNIGDKRKHDGGLYCIPEIFMMSMMDSGWLLMDKVIWAKVVTGDDGKTIGGCMTEPANNRLNGNGYEFLYRFSKTRDAWFDPQSVSIPRQEKEDVKTIRYMPKELMRVETSTEGRNLNNVWRVDMGQTTNKHYAVYPTTLVERPIAMSCPMKVCKSCGFLETRIVEKVEYDEGRSSKRVFGKYNSLEGGASKDIKSESGRSDIGSKYIPRKPVTRGWTSCGHEQEPGTVLDPFCGSGTTGEVAIKLGRNFIGIDIYEKFLEMTRNRCHSIIQQMRDKKIDPWELRK